MKLDLLLRRAVREGASDVFVQTGSPPFLRIAGAVIAVDEPPIAEEVVETWIRQIAPDGSVREKLRHGQLDLAYQSDEAGRFRVNVFRQKGRWAMCFRTIPGRVPTFEQLQLPADRLIRLASLPRGLVLVTGVAGSGKSTTLAAMIQHINETAAKHIVTIEDPIEYVFRNKQSLIDQREIGRDTANFTEALAHVVRQSPDVILIGEMRDVETMRAALHAAETGHLVLSTLHTSTAMQTVDRIMNFFDPHEHGFVRQQLSLLLEGVISQRLLPNKGQTARVPAVEIMSATPTTRELLLQGRTRELYRAIKEGDYFGCRTFNQSLIELLQADRITVEEAMRNADNAEELRLQLRGIRTDADPISQGNIR